MHFFSVWTQRAWSLLWLQVALALALAAAKNLTEKGYDVLPRLYLFALLFVSITATVLGRLVCVVFFERGLLWRLLRRGLRKLWSCLTFVLFKATSTQTGKVLVTFAVIYCLASLSYWAYIHVSVELIKASWRFLAALPRFLLALDLARLANAGEDWINAWVLRLVVEYLQALVLQQRDLILKKPLWSLAFMTFVLAGLAVAWFVVERAVGLCKRSLATCAEQLESQMRDEEPQAHAHAHAHGTHDEFKAA